MATRLPGRARTARSTRRSKRERRRRVAASLGLAVLFFAGAALSATAGDVAVGLVASTGETTIPTTTGDEAIPPDERPVEEVPPADVPSGEDGEPIPPPEPAPASDGEVGGAPPEAAPPSGAAPPGTTSESGDSVAHPPAPASLPSSAPGAATAGSGSRSAPRSEASPLSNEGRRAKPGARRAGTPVLRPRRGAAETPLDPETKAAGAAATVWLHRTLPDPTPPAKRLAPSFARTLRHAARAEGIGWPLLLGVVRAQGNGGRVPATPSELDTLATRLAGAGAAREPWRAALALEGSVSFADQAVALARYNAAVGLWALTHGFAAAKPRLERRVLGDRRIELYPGGRADIAAGRIDVRVLVLLRYLRVAHGQVTVSSLQTGHGFWARPGFVSAHVYGLAVDISMVGGKPILGNQGPLGVTERAVRDVLLLPAEVRPQQIISLLALGGPSFALADHHDHIHVGF